MRFSRVNIVTCILAAAIMTLPSAVLGASSHGAQGKEWTIMLYYCADNNLEFAAEFNLMTIEGALTSNDNVNFIFLEDFNSVPGITIYEIVGGKRKVIAAWEEKNTSDPAVLKEFALYGMKNFPAEKTMLIISDHGYGWRGACEDYTDGDWLMTVDGLAGAMKEIQAKSKRGGVDILAFDACSMATIEVVYELRGTVPYLIATQSTEPYDGFPYQMFVSDLVEDPGMSPLELATLLPYEYVLYYSSKWEYDHIYNYCQDFVTMASIDMSKVDALGEAFVTMTEVLEGLVPEHWEALEEARGEAFMGVWCNIVAGYEWMPDAYTLFDELKGIDPELDESIDAFESAFDQAIIAEANSERLGDKAQGLNIWFPPSLFLYNPESWSWLGQFVYHDIGLDLVAESSWVDCLMAYYECKDS